MERAWVAVAWEAVETVAVAAGGVACLKVAVETEVVLAGAVAAAAQCLVVEMVVAAAKVAAKAEGPVAAVAGRAGARFALRGCQR